MYAALQPTLSLKDVSNEILVRLNPNICTKIKRGQLQSLSFLFMNYNWAWSCKIFYAIKQFYLFLIHKGCDSDFLNVTFY